MPRNLILIAVVLLAAVGGAFWYATSPATTGGHSMTPPDTSQLAEGAPLVEVAMPQEIVGRAALGQTAFDAKCAVCHGPNAAGRNGVAPPLVHKIYEPGHHGDYAFLNAVTNGVRSHHWNFGNMQPVEGLTKSDVANIVAYVRLLQRENGIQ